MKVSTWIAEELVREGITHVFALDGGFVMHIVDSIHYSGLKPVYMLDEKACAFAASAHSMYDGKLSVVVVTSGPGSTNALTGVASAYYDSVPILIISGDVRIPHLEMRRKYHLREGGPQDVDIVSMAVPITKYIAIAETPSQVKLFFRDAIKFVMSNRRGPAWLVVPLDVQSMEMEDD